MSKWLDRLAELPENRQWTNSALPKLTERNSVGVVSTELGESDFKRSPEVTGKSWHAPNSALTDPTQTAFARSSYDEESGLPLDWLEGYRRLAVMRRPLAIPQSTWTWMQAAAGELLTRWGRQLAAHGWTTLEVFGVHFEAPMPRIDCAGLLAMLSGHHKIEAVSAKSVSLRTESGAVLHYYRPLATNPGIISVWELTTGAPPHSTADSDIA